MNRDLTAILNEWAYEPGQINVRLIEGRDGEPRIQVRLDLGLLQMETTGRPDGLTPHGYASYLEYFEHRLDGVLDDEEPQGDISDATDGLDLGSDDPGPTPADFEPAAHDPTEPNPVDVPANEDDIPPGPGPGSPERLSPDECRLLREEAAQFYHRYVALLVLEDYEGVVRDTGRNLRVLDLCAAYAESEEDRDTLEQVRPYILMMRARALASLSLEEREPKAALLAIDRGLEQLREHFGSIDAGDEFDSSSEVQMLRSMREALIPKLPVSQKAELRQRLREAIERENYELAAILRDELRQMKE
jgi:hypothetical protein